MWLVVSYCRGGYSRQNWCSPIGDGYGENCFPVRRHGAVACLLKRPGESNPCDCRFAVSVMADLDNSFLLFGWMTGWMN